MHVFADLDEVMGDTFDNGEALFRVGMFDEFLAEIVSKGVGHEFDNVFDDFPEDLLDSLGAILVQPFL